MGARASLPPGSPERLQGWEWGWVRGEPGLLSSGETGKQEATRRHGLCCLGLAIEEEK